MQKKTLTVAITILIGIMLISSTSASITPITLSATLLPGQSITEDKTVFLPGTIPKGDVIFAIDCTSSMSAAIATAKAQAINIMTAIGTLISDCQFGLMSFMDYPHSYDSFGYSDTYGDASSGDYAYKLNQPLTSNTATVSNAINALSIGFGEDGPQDYARIIFESYSDTTIGWRTGAKHILLILGDAVPHYENLNEGISGNSSLPYWPGNYSTGGDPGRDEIMFTADDIYLPTALQAMATNQITLLYVKCHDDAYPNDTSNMMYWNYWTSITGGSAYSISDASMVPTAIAALIQVEATHIHKLTLQVQEPSFSSWLTSVTPSEYDEFDIPTGGVNKTFSITITVPLCTVPGTYVFNITANADGASYGEEMVTIVVPLPWPGCIYEVVRGMDNGIYYRAGNGAWLVLPGATCDSPAAAMLGNELCIVVRGMDGNTLWYGYLSNPADPSSFSGWTLLGGSTKSAPTLTSNSNTLCLIVRGLDDRIYYRWYSCGSWGSWSAVPTGTTCDSPAAAMLGNNLHIVVRGMDRNSLWDTILGCDGTVVRGWSPISGATPAKPVLACSGSDNLCLVVRGMDNRIYYRSYTGCTDSWGDWSASPTGATIDGPGATVMGNMLYTVVRGMDGSTLWCGDIDLGTSSFSGWTLLAGATPSAPTMTS